MTGNLPENLALLEYIESISFAENSLNGGLPKPLSTLKNLRILNLESNQFSGTVPMGWLCDSENNSSEAANPSMWDLVDLRLQENPALSWSFPTEFGNALTNLRVLLLTNTGLTGTLPSGLSKLTDLCKTLLKMTTNFIISVANSFLATSLNQIISPRC